MKSITQSYMLCALNENGKLPTMRNEISVCLVASAVVDLLLDHCMEANNKN